jgi:hypothetical protein
MKLLELCTLLGFDTCNVAETRRTRVATRATAIRYNEVTALRNLLRLLLGD